MDVSEGFEQGLDDAGPVDVSAADVLTVVFASHYAHLVRLAALLLKDAHQAEDVVQDAYVRVAARPAGLRDPDKALAYLSRVVINLAKNSFRRQILVRRHATVLMPSPAASAEEHAIAAFHEQAIVAALQSLPRRQREVVILRYYLDYSVEETARLLHLRAGSVKAYASRGLENLRSFMTREENP